MEAMAHLIIDGLPNLKMGHGFHGKLLVITRLGSNALDEMKLHLAPQIWIESCVRCWKFNKFQ